MDKGIKVWDLKTGKLKATLEGQRREISGIAFTPDRRRVVGCSGLSRVQSADSGDVFIWDIDSGQLVLDLAAHWNMVFGGVAVSPDGEHIYGIANFLPDPSNVENSRMARGNVNFSDPPKAMVVCWDALPMNSARSQNKPR